MAVVSAGAVSVGGPIAWLVSDTDRTTQDAPTLMAAGPAGCTDPATFGALPDDGLDDRPLIQAWLDEQPPGDCVALCFRPGVYEITRTGGTDYRRLAGLSLERSCTTIWGAGRATALLGTGSGGGPTGNFSVMSIRGAGDGGPVSGVEIRDLRVSGTAITDSGEQTHLIEVGARLGTSRGAEQVVLRHLWLDIPPKEGETRGDCVRLYGAPAMPTRDVRILDSTFSDCDRSSIAVQHYVTDLLVTGNSFLEVGDQHLDLEPSDGPLGRHVYAQNVFRSARPAALSIALAGSTAPASEIVFSENVVDGRGVYLYQLSHAVVAHNVIQARLGAEVPLVRGIKLESSVILEGNILRRLAGSDAGPVVLFGHHGTAMPGPLSLTNNLIEQEGPGDLVVLNSISGVVVSANQLLYSGPPGAWSAVAASGLAAPIDDLVISGNRTSGPLAYAVRLTPRAQGVRSAVVSGNSSRGCSAGLRCDPGVFATPPVVAGNSFGGVLQVGCTTVANQLP